MHQPDTAPAPSLLSAPPHPPHQKPLHTLHFLLLTLPMSSAPEGMRLNSMSLVGGGGAGTRQSLHQGQRSVPLNKLTPLPVNCILFPRETQEEGTGRLSSD